MELVFGVLRGGLSGGRLELGKQQARLLYKAEQVIFGERPVKFLRGELIFAAFERKHVPLVAATIEDIYCSGCIVTPPA